MTRPTLLAILAIILSLIPLPALSQNNPTAAIPRFKVTDVSRFNGKDVGTIVLIDKGQVGFPLLSQMMFHVYWRPHIYLWQNGIKHDIGILGNDPNVGSFPVAINNQGQLLTMSDYNTNDDKGSSYLWENNRLRQLGNFKAHALNEHCSVVGAIVSDFLNRNSRAVVWENGKIHLLPGLPDRPQAEADAINDKDQIVGSAQAPYGNEAAAKKRPDLYASILPQFNLYRALSHACLWQNGKVTALALPPGMAQTYAIGINNKGQILGSATVRIDVNTQIRAMIWDHGKIIFLGSLGNPPTYAKAINDSSQVVGTGFLQGKQSYGVSRAFLWQNGKMYNLNSLIPKNSGWILQDATGINNRGQIVGYGQMKSKSGSYKMHIFLLTPR